MLKAVATLTTMVLLSATLVPSAGAAPAASTLHPGVGGSGAAACVASYPSPADAGGRPFGVTAGPGGTWYSAGNTLNKIHRGSTTTYTVAGVDASDPVGLGWLTWDGRDTIWFAARADGRIGTITGDGTVTTIQVPDGANGPAIVQGFVLHPGRDVWFSDQDSNRIGDYSLITQQFTFYQTPSEGPQSLAEGHDGDLYFVERPVDKVGRLDPRTSLFTEWSLPAGSLPNRIITTPDGAEWFTALFGNYVGRIKDGYLTTYPVDGGPVGITYSAGRLWTALFTSGGLAELSLRGNVIRTWSTPATIHCWWAPATATSG